MLGAPKLLVIFDLLVCGFDLWFFPPCRLRIIWETGCSFTVDLSTQHEWSFGASCLTGGHAFSDFMSSSSSRSHTKTPKSWVEAQTAKASSQQLAISKNIVNCQPNADGVTSMRDGVINCTVMCPLVNLVDLSVDLLLQKISWLLLFWFCSVRLTEKWDVACFQNDKCF